MKGAQESGIWAATTELGQLSVTLKETSATERVTEILALTSQPH